MGPTDPEETRYIMAKLVLRGSGASRYYEAIPIKPEKVHIQTIEEAEPMKHGKWLPDRTRTAYWICSCCGFPSEAHGAFKLYKYCPNCGADMRGEQDEMQ